MAGSFSILQGFYGLDDFPPGWGISVNIKVGYGLQDVWKESTRTFFTGLRTSCRFYGKFFRKPFRPDEVMFA